MIGERLVQLPAGRMYLGEHTIRRRLGAEASRLGKSAVVLTDETVWPKAADEVTAALDQAGLKWELLFHTGHCCPGAYGKVRDHAGQMNADMIIGIGGGRLLDTAKIAADQAKICCVTVPSSAATCAASAWLSVEYSDEGDFGGNYWTEYPPFCTIIDTGLIVKRCPARLNMAGVVDAMAKYPEIGYNLKYTENFSKNAFSEVAAELAEKTYGFFSVHFKELMEKFRLGVVDDMVEDAAAKAIAVTGLVSSLACGGKQAAVAHLIYSYICCHHPRIAGRYLHGEIVGASLCYQIVVDGWDICETEKFRRLLCDAGMPACLAELGLPADAAEQERIFAFLKKGMDLSREETERLRDPRNIGWLFEGRQ